MIRAMRHARVLTLAEVCAEVWGWDSAFANEAVVGHGITLDVWRRVDACMNASGTALADLELGSRRYRYRVVNERRFKAWARWAKHKFVAGFVDAGLPDG